MATYHDDPLANSPASAKLRAYLVHRASAAPLSDPEAFAQFEREIRSLVIALGAECVARELERHDLANERIECDGIVYNRVLKAAETYHTALGDVRVVRHIFRPSGGGPALCPLERTVGMVEKTWTPLAARIVALLAAELPPSDAARLLAEVGELRPSASSLDRLPKALSERWEENRKEWEESIRLQDSVPRDAVGVAFSIDGVHVPLKKPKGAPKEEKAAWREAGCATATFFDRDTKPLKTIRMARMPEEKKATLKSMLSAEYRWALEERPDLEVVKVADGAEDNWEYLREEIHPGRGTEILDFYHAAVRLKSAADAAMGPETKEARALFESWKTTLKEKSDGAATVIRTLIYRRDQAKGSARATLEKELNYFRTMRHGMRYAEYAEAGLPIGSGMVEAACKTLVTERLKQSGMRWTLRGGQGILTLRSLLQSGRFEKGWALIQASYHCEVKPIEDRQPRKAG